MTREEFIERYAISIQSGEGEMLPFIDDLDSLLRDERVRALDGLTRLMDRQCANLGASAKFAEAHQWAQAIGEIHQFIKEAKEKEAQP